MNIELPKNDPDMPQIIIDDAFGGYAISFDDGAYADFLSRFVQDKSAVRDLKIHFARIDADDAAALAAVTSDTMPSLTLGSYNHCTQQITLYFDALAIDSSSPEEFEEKCRETLLHETGHHIDYIANEGLGQESIESKVYSYALVGGLAAGMCAAVGCGYEALRARRMGGTRRRALGYMAAASSALLLRHFGDPRFQSTDYYYYSISENERFAREFADYHAGCASFLEATQLHHESE